MRESGRNSADPLAVVASFGWQTFTKPRRETRNVITRDLRLFAFSSKCVRPREESWTIPLLPGRYAGVSTALEKLADAVRERPFQLQECVSRKLPDRRSALMSSGDGRRSGRRGEERIVGVSNFSSLESRWNAGIASPEECWEPRSENALRNPAKNHLGYTMTSASAEICSRCRYR